MQLTDPLALVTQVRAHLAGDTHLPIVIVDYGVLDGTNRAWRDHHGCCGVVPATAIMAVTVDAQVQAAAGEGRIPDRRVRTGPYGQGRVAETQRLEPEGVGMTGQTIDDQ
jgi:hypothetical protein